MTVFGLLYLPNGTLNLPPPLTRYRPLKHVRFRNSILAARPRRRTGTVFIAPATAIRVSFDSEGRLTRRGRLRWGAIGALLAAIATVPMAYLASIGVMAWPVAAAVAAVLAGAYAFMYAHMYRTRSRMRRLRHLADRVISLCKSLPRGTDVETLAVLHEIRTCYGEACRVAARLDGRGGRLADSMRETMARLDGMYDARSASLRRTDANAADFAAAMRRLGRDVDGSSLGVP